MKILRELGMSLNAISLQNLEKKYQPCSCEEKSGQNF